MVPWPAGMGRKGRQSVSRLVAGQVSLGSQTKQEGFPEFRVVDYDARDEDWGVRGGQEQSAALLIFRKERC